MHTSYYEESKPYPNQNQYKVQSLHYLLLLLSTDSLILQYEVLNTPGTSQDKLMNYYFNTH